MFAAINARGSSAMVNLGPGCTSADGEFSFRYYLLTGLRQRRRHAEIAAGIGSTGFTQRIL